MKAYPTYRQREVLQLLMSGAWMPLLKLIPIGDKLLATLLVAGWSEAPRRTLVISIASQKRDGPPIEHQCP